MNWTEYAYVIYTLQVGFWNQILTQSLPSKNRKQKRKMAFGYIPEYWDFTIPILS